MSAVVTCRHCRKRRTCYEWTVDVCADNGPRIFYLCEPCDILLNTQTLEFFRVPDIAVKMANYRG